MSFHFFQSRMHEIWGDIASTRSPVGLIALLLSIFLYARLCSGPNLSKFPRAGKDPGFLGWKLAAAKRDFYKNGPAIINEGYRKFKNKIYRVQTLNVERLILSPKYVEEINRCVPDEKLDMAEGLRERLLGAQTNLDVVFRSSLHIDVCKSQLSHNLHNLIEPIHEEVDYWLNKRIPGRMEIPAYETMVRIISATASRMLGGPSVSRDPTWLESAARYSMDVVAVAIQLRPYPALVRPLIAPWLEGIKILDGHLRIAKKTFTPALEKYLARRDRGDGHDEGKDSAHMVQWMAESAQGRDKDAGVLAHNMLFMALAGVHTSVATTTQVLFDLCTHPEYIVPLREEIEQVIDRYGWSMSALASCKKLDSFMKESQRLNQAVLMTFNRRVVSDITFEDGTIIPAGTYITMPSDAVARDPEIYSNPEEFDGMRFYEKRMSSLKEANRHQFATTGPESLAFGQGKTACPGRFFAASQIKILISEILLRYDISFPGQQTQRPKNVHKGGLVSPDRRQKILFSPR